MLGRSKFALCKCFCAAKAFYGAKAPKGTEWVGVPASIEGAGRCCRFAARRDGDYCGVLSLDAGALPVRMQVKMAVAYRMARMRQGDLLKEKR